MLFRSSPVAARSLRVPRSSRRAGRGGRRPTAARGGGAIPHRPDPGCSACRSCGRVCPTPHLRWPCWTGPVKHGFVARSGDWPQPPYRGPGLRREDGWGGGGRVPAQAGIPINRALASPGSRPAPGRGLGRRRAGPCELLPITCQLRCQI